MTTVPPYPGAPSTTNVTGYYNPFSYPFHLDVSEIGLRLTLNPRQFICTSHDTLVDGKPATVNVKVNDPVFELYVGPNRLAKETSQNPVPIVWLPRMDSPERIDVEFAGVQKFKTDDSGRVVDPRGILASGETVSDHRPAGSSASVASFSVKEAIRLGVIDGKGRLEDEQTTQKAAIKEATALPRFEKPMQPAEAPKNLLPPQYPKDRTQPLKAPSQPAPPAAVLKAPSIPAPSIPAPSIPAPSLPQSVLPARVEPKPAVSVERATESADAPIVMTAPPVVTTTPIGKSELTDLMNPADDIGSDVEDDTTEAVDLASVLSKAVSKIDPSLAGSEPVGVIDEVKTEAPAPALAQAEVPQAEAARPITQRRRRASSEPVSPAQP